MAAVAQRAVMEILGHRDPRMTMRYQHLSPGHLKDAMRALDHAVTLSADHDEGNGGVARTAGA
jgi:integrase